MNKDSNRKRKIGRIIVLVLVLAFLWCVLLLGLLYIFRQMVLISKNMKVLGEASYEALDGNQFDLSGRAECTDIYEYIYDEEGTLTCRCDYSEKDNDSEQWSWRQEIFYTYDTEGRLIKEESFFRYLDMEEPYRLYEYEYLADGSYITTETTQGLWPIEVTRTRYNSDGKVVYSESSDQAVNYYYTYDNQGRLLTIANSETISSDALLTEIRWDEENLQSMGIRYLNGSDMMWLDQYDKDWNQISGIWYEAEVEDWNWSVKETKLSSIPSYYADYNNGLKLEEMLIQRTRDVENTYMQRYYNFYDYDEQGRIIWEYTLNWATWQADFDAVQYLYDEDGLLWREMHYAIDKDWEHQLMDDSTIEVHMDEKGYPTNISRTDANGKLIHSFLFDENQELAYQTDETGEVAVWWQLTGEQLLAMQEDVDTDKPGDDVPGEGESDEDGPNGGSDEEGFYYVQSGDCLWTIAEELYGDGRLWTLLYERNKDLIGNNPSLIYPGMKLSYH